ncbi:hypothetical protein D3C72_2250740 [compost metagenome]
MKMPAKVPTKAPPKLCAGRCRLRSSGLGARRARRCAKGIDRTKVPTATPSRISSGPSEAATSDPKTICSFCSLR